MKKAGPNGPANLLHKQFPKRGDPDQAAFIASSSVRMVNSVPAS